MIDYGALTASIVSALCFYGLIKSISVLCVRLIEKSIVKNKIRKAIKGGNE